jgi:hypothetical protein
VTTQKLMTNPFQRDPEQLVFDHMTEAYFCWREECVAVAEAFTGWCAAPRHERADAWAVYRAALELEEQAAIAYRNHALRARDHLTFDDLAAA